MDCLPAVGTLQGAVILASLQPVNAFSSCETLLKMMYIAAGNADSAKKVLDLMKRAGISPTAEACTSLMAACIKQGSADNIAYAFQVPAASLAACICVVHNGQYCFC